jgi:hypothetical protein
MTSNPVGKPIHHLALGEQPVIFCRKSAVRGSLRVAGSLNQPRTEEFFTTTKALGRLFKRSVKHPVIVGYNTNQGF